MRQRVVQGITAFVIVAFALYLYGVALYHPTHAQPLITRTFLDDFVPYVPSSVWVYASAHPLAPVLFAFLPQDIFRALLRRCFVLIPLQMGSFFLVTTAVDRRPAPTGDDATSSLLRALYELDSPPLNAAPSAHVTLALLIAYGAWRGFPRLRVGIAGYALAVVMSVVTTGQHHMLDALLAIALVGVVLAVFALVEARRTQPRVAV